jgi:transposase
VNCPAHGVVVAAVPWARHGARFTSEFEDQAAWLATRTDKTSVTELLRIGWRTIGRIIERVSDEGRRGRDLWPGSVAGICGRDLWPGSVAGICGRDLLSGLRRIGNDEISDKKGHKYVVVVVDHDTGRLVWPSEGRTKATLGRFFDALGTQRCAAIELVSADGASWIHEPVARRCPNATRCLDPFHAVQWVSRALDTVRRELWSSLRKSGNPSDALSLQRSRFALWKNPEDLTESQQATLSSIQQTNKGLYRAYLLKEQFRETIRLKGCEGKALLDRWCAWAQRSRLKPFVKFCRAIRRHRAALDAAVDHNLSNARVEGLNTRLRLIRRLAFGFHSARAFIALGMLKLGGLCPSLPGRA